jgi:hypothetical protein
MSLPDVEGYLRAGCIHMTLEALLPVREGWALLPSFRCRLSACLLDCC